MVAATMASCDHSSRPSPPSACAPTISATPASPATTPASLRIVTGSCAVNAHVMRKVKIGAVELRMVARPASTTCWPHAISVNGTTLLSSACTRKLRQVTASRGNGMRRAAITAPSSAEAIRVRAAIKVSGGMLSTPTRMKLYDAPHSVASASRSAKSSPRAALLERVVQLGDQVVDALDADREAHQAVVDAQPGAHVLRQRGVGHDRRVLDQALDPAQALGEREQAAALEEALRGIEPALQHRGDHAAVAGVHLAQREGLDAAQREEGVERARHAADGVLQERELVLQRVVAQDRRAADHVGMAVQVLGGGVHHDVEAMLDRPLDPGRGEGVGAHRDDLVLARDFGDRG